MKKSLTALVVTGLLMSATSPDLMAMMKEEEEMDPIACSIVWEYRVLDGFFKESDMPILAKQVQKFKINPLENTTTEKMIEEIKESVTSKFFTCTMTQALCILDFANILDKNLVFLEKDKQTKLFINSILYSAIRKLKY